MYYTTQPSHGPKQLLLLSDNCYEIIVLTDLRYSLIDVKTFYRYDPSKVCFKSTLIPKFFQFFLSSLECFCGLRIFSPELSARVPHVIGTYTEIS